MTRNTPVRFSRARYATAALVVALGLGALSPAALSADVGGRVLADETPTLLPISPPKFASVFPAMGPDAAQYDLSLSILDFDPGAATREQSRPGQLFATVVDGQITVREGSEETVYVQGEKFTQDPDVFGFMTNTTSNRTRVFMTVLSPSGAPVEVSGPDSSVPALAPTVALSGTTTVDAVAGEFRLTQGIYEFVPGAGSGAHSHSGPGITVVISGELTDRIPGDDISVKVGDVFAEIPGRPVDHRNFGAESAIVAVSYLAPVGLPFAVAESLPGSPPLLSPPAPAPTPTPVV